MLAVLAQAFGIAQQRWAWGNGGWQGRVRWGKEVPPPPDLISKISLISVRFWVCSGVGAKFAWGTAVGKAGAVGEKKYPHPPI